MDFKAFCRSVLLAQNRFSEFLKATPAQRDEVLKGVFGYERLDEAQRVAKSRLRSGGARAGGARRRSASGSTRRARGSRRRARTPRSPSARLRRPGGRRPRGRAADEGARDAAAADDAADAEQIASLIAGHRRRCRTPTTSRRPCDAASAADERVATRPRPRSRRRSRRSSGGGRARRRRVAARRPRTFRSFDRLWCQQHGTGVEGARRGQGRRSSRPSERPSRRPRSSRAAARSWRRPSTALAGATDAEATAAARSRWHVPPSPSPNTPRWRTSSAASLVAGEPCPVCEQPVGAIPKGRAAPKVAAADRAVARADGALRRRRATSEGAAPRRRRASAATAVEEADARAEESGANHERTAERLRAAEAAIATTNGQLVEWLGDEGDARTLVRGPRGRAGRAPSERGGGARDAVDGGRADLERDGAGAAAQAGRQLASFANRLSGAWGRLGEDRDVAADPAAIRDAFVSLGEAVLVRHADAEERRADATARRRAGGDRVARSCSRASAWSPRTTSGRALTEAGVRPRRGRDGGRRRSRPDRAEPASSKDGSLEAETRREPRAPPGRAT